MIDLAVRGVTKAFEKDKNILDGISFDINTGERAGLLGRNGAGKTTLFRVITGEYECDSGDALLANGKRTGILAQIPVYPPGFTVEDVLLKAQSRQLDLIRTLGELSGKLDNPAALREYDELSVQLEAAGGYELDYVRDKTANGLNIPAKMRKSLFAELSGGEKTRVNLARLLLEGVDLLLLDEPTNHLDMKSIAWLEEYLVGAKLSALIISHDRYFLDAVLTRVIELEAGKVELYSGNYTSYVAEKQRREELAAKQFAQMDKEASRLRETALMFRQYGTEIAIKRAKNMERRIERLRASAPPPAKKEGKLKASFTAREFRGDELMIAQNLSKAYGERTLFSGVSLEIRAGERIALLGDNGTGKSTLINILANLDKPDSGTVRFSPSAKTAYLEQHVTFANVNRSLYDTVIYETNCPPQEARNRLGLYHFRGEDVFKPISVLSGGELSCLRLCILMRGDINLLMLDEPTNHLDILAREWLEDALDEYDEAILFVSHDRYFIERFATRFWTLENGVINDFSGNYKQYIARPATAAAVPPRSGNFAPTLSDVPKSEAKHKGGRSKPPDKSRQLAKLEAEIAKQETALNQINAEIEENASNYEALTELYAKKEAADFALNELYENFAELEY
ncbi:MAG: ABC-F family ATP-binding cassette domain-containing protein [Oscillospiraceae bacterium]|jgi:ATPase subunit of ABC transporter with duplicated ATPase domains|nr:ABC-F family ATP-binding cassette domain-containing protein [Oscillospiraceae bacterium]